MFMRILF